MGESKNKLLAAFQSKRIFVTLLLGFSSGIPLALTGSTLQAWMTRSGVSIATIGTFTLVGIPYIVKFLWAPFLDRYSLPFLGKRRGWLLLFQILLFLAILLLGRLDPTSQIHLMAVFALLVSFFSASQDIVVDALRTEIVSQEEQGPAAGVYVTGYRVAMLVSSALAFMLADQMDWGTVYLIMACTIGVGIAATLLADEPEAAPPKAKSLDEAFTKPLIDYFSRKGAVEIALFIVLYKIGDTMAAILTTPFLVQQGYSNTVIGTFNKFLGGGATILGATAGGALMVKWGMQRSLVVFGILQAVSTLVYVFLTMLPPSTAALATAIGVENLCAGLGTAAFTAFLMRLCQKGETAGQYAVLSSFMAFGRVMLGPVAGSLSEKLGWSAFFVISTVVAVPGTLMIARFPAWMEFERSEPAESGRVKPATIYGFIGFLILFLSVPIFLNRTLTPLAVLASLAGLMSLVAVWKGARGAPRAALLGGLNLAAILAGWLYLNGQS